MRISNDASRCNLAYTRSKILSFKWSFKMRNSNYALCSRVKTVNYPFHIAKCAVTPHWTPLSIHPLCCCYTPVCFHTECRISAFWRVRFKKRSKIEQKDIITPMHCLAFPSALFGAPFHIDNRTVANCGFWLEYASKTPLEVGADLPRRMRLFWLRCQIMRLRSVHIKPHYSQNAFDSALLAWYEWGKRYTTFSSSTCARICFANKTDLQSKSAIKPTLHSHWWYGNTNINCFEWWAFLS